MERKDITVFIGCFAHSTWDTALEILPNMAIGVYNGKILFIQNRKNLPNLIEEHNLPEECIRYLEEREILIPGFVDCHTHASQFFNCGIGYDVQLLDWLNQYIFPLEDKFKDIEFAKHAYTAVVSSLVRNGTTTACYFATIHTDATLVLCDIADKIGQRAYVGKVCMDQNEGSSYKESTKESLQETERFIGTVQKRQYRLITPVVTPRFAISCSEELMKGLAHIAQKNDLPIQTHINENEKEIAEVERLFPNKTYAGTYYSMGLLKSKTILAHNIYCPRQDLELIKNQQAGVCHCPNSNTSLKSGTFWARQHLDADIKLGLGTGEPVNAPTNLSVEIQVSVASGSSNQTLELFPYPDLFLAMFLINWLFSIDADKWNRRTEFKLGIHSAPLSRGIDFSCRLWANKEGIGDQIYVSGGFSSSILDAMRGTTGVSNLLSDGTAQKAPVDYKEAFRLATLGGSKVLGLDDQIGNFEVGKEFDALLIELPQQWDQPPDNGENWDRMFSKLFYLVVNETIMTQKESPSSPTRNPLDIDMKSVAAQLSLAFLGIFATAVFAVFVFLVWNLLRKMRNVEEDQKLPYVRLGPSNLPLVCEEDQVQPKRKRGHSLDGSSSDSLLCDQNPNKESITIELPLSGTTCYGTPYTAWCCSPQYPQRAWN